MNSFELVRLLGDAIAIIALLKNELHKIPLVTGCSPHLPGDDGW